MAYLLTFLEGVITFVSPCLLPMLPIYLAYFAGDARSRQGGEVARTLPSALGFVLGFGLVFTVFGAFAGALGAALLRHQRLLDGACGLVMMFLGLNYLGAIRVTVLMKTWRPKTDIIPRGFASSLLFGTVFAIGWTPCVGTFLASALSLAATSGSTLQGVALLVCYSAGLGLPFMVSAVLIDQLEGAFGWVKAHYGVIDKACGLLLVVVGALMASGHLGLWLRTLSVL